MINNNLYSPLEIFQVKNLINLNLFGLNMSISNTTIYLIISISLFIFLFNISNNNQLKLNKWSFILYKIIDLLQKEIISVINIKSNKFLPFLLSLFIFLVLNNVIGLIPYSFTTTSQIIITLLLSFSIILGVTIIGILIHKFHFVHLFIPKGVPLPFLFLMIPIEIISYVSRIISLSIRLSANMISGHCILYIISSFSIKLASLFFLKYLLFVPILLLIFFLELGVCIIQAYIFTILSSIFIKDSVYLH